MPKVSASVVKWARESAGLTAEQAAKKLGVKPERLEDFEAGRLEPTYRQLTNMADGYRRPIVTFFLPTPPKQMDGGHDFRTLPQEDRELSQPLVSALLRDVHARHDLLKSALQEADDAVPLTFVGSLRMAQGVKAVVESLRKLLNVSQAQFRQQRNANEAFALLRRRAEEAGVYVLLIGNLGTHHTDIEVTAFRGFALADPVAPFVVINEKDTRSAWSFTLLHELTHILLGQTGVSGYQGDEEVEKFCDLAAANFLLDDDDLVQFENGPKVPDDWATEIGLFAEERNLSRGMVAYNLWATGRISKALYRELVGMFARDRGRRAELAVERDGAPSYYTVRKHRLGRALIASAGRLVKSGVLSTTKAGVVLGVKATSVPRLVSQSA